MFESKDKVIIKSYWVFSPVVLLHSRITWLYIVQEVPVSSEPEDDIQIVTTVWNEIFARV